MLTVGSNVKAVIRGAVQAKALRESYDIHTIGDLLRHYPRRYVERGQLTPIEDLRVGEDAIVVAEIVEVNGRRMRQRKGHILDLTVTDGNAILTLAFFNQPWREQYFHPGMRCVFWGTVNSYKGRKQLAHPQVLLLTDDEIDHDDVESYAGALIPIYPATAKVNSGRIMTLIRSALDQLGPTDDPIPPDVRKRRRLPELRAALEAIHRPDSWEDQRAAARRFKFEEAFVLQTELARRRSDARSLPATPRRPISDGLLGAFDAQLPFELTAGQTEVSTAITEDLAQSHPMQRLLQGEVGSGKAQPLDSQVLTPTGFSRMGDIRVGDGVVTPSGSVAPVVGVYPQGERDVYRVVFSDGSSVECDEEHLWPVKTDCGWYRGDALKVLSLKELRSDLTKGPGRPKWYLPLVEPPDLDNGEPREIDPYLLGLLLGDGHMSHGRVTLTTADSEIVAAARSSVPDGCRLERSESRPLDWLILGLRRGAGNPLIAALRRLCLYGKLSHDKFVPGAYLAAPLGERHALLQGLLDTDGTINSRQGSNVSFTSASRRLAEDVAYLARSLGGYARCRAIRKVGRQYWMTSLCLPNRFAPFRLARKANLVRPRSEYERRRKAIREVEYVGRKAVQCIAVDHPDHQYVTDGWAPTHNTVVAIRAMLTVVDAGGQAALLAPTEVLAQQHHRTITDLLGPLAERGMLGGSEHGTRVALLTGSLGAAARRNTLLEVASGEAGIVVGTHALLEDRVMFADLGLVVVDEQHRFGVEQRAALTTKNGDAPPHVLVMTATPIPRTVAMTVFGDLEISTLTELPKGRAPIQTTVVPVADQPKWLDRVWERVREEVDQGRQVYVVCPRIGDDADEGAGAVADPGAEQLRPAQALVELAEELSSGPLDGLRLGVLHGRLPADAKDEVMRSFAAGQVDVLVATTVIEVGVDVPNASVMVVMDADWFGVSQLHQLRGRIGRGELPGLCLLVTGAEADSPARERLSAVASTTDGFKLSQLDLEQRREGDVLGSDQSGRRSSLRMLKVIRDRDVIEQARAEATEVVERDPALGEHPALAEAVGALYDTERADFLEKT